MIVAKFKEFNIEIEIRPLENGKCQYLVDFHDFGNLESLVGRVLNYEELNNCLKNPKNYIRENRYA